MYSEAYRIQVMKEGNELAAENLATAELDDMFDRSGKNEATDDEAAQAVNLDTL